MARNTRCDSPLRVLRHVEAQFNEGKEKARIRGENYMLPANFALQNGRGYVPLSSAPQVLSKLLGKPVQLHQPARRLFIGEVAMHFSMELDRGNPPKLVVSFPAAVNPTIATEPGSRAFYLSSRACRFRRTGQLQLQRLRD